MKKEVMQKRLENILLLTRTAREEKTKKSARKIAMIGPRLLQQMARAAVRRHLPILLEYMEDKAKQSDYFVFIDIPVPYRLHPSVIRKYCKAYASMVAKILGQPFQINHSVYFGSDFNLQVEWPW